MYPAGQARPAYFLYQLFWQMLDWIFPPICGGCSASGTRWCRSCQDSISKILGTICPQCGKPQADSTPCPACIQNPPDYIYLRAFAAFQGPLRSALHRLKYQKDIGLGEALSKHLIEIYNLEKWPIDMVTPVPISPQRLKERGYNQASLLARPFAYAIQKPFRPNIIVKSRETRTQVGLSAMERKQNVEGAFSCRSTLVKSKAILIIDDVTTTGSTISACAQAFHKAGASAVYGLTLTRAVLQADADDLPKTITTNWR